MGMITNSFNSLPTSLVHLHRMLQFIMWSVLILSSWHQHSSQLLGLVILIFMILYQSCALLLNAKITLASNHKITLLIAFTDGIITGLLIKLCGLQYSLTVGIIGLFLLVYVETLSFLTLAAILGVVSTIVTANLSSFPSFDVTKSIEIILLILMTVFCLVFCLFRGYQGKALNKKLESQFKANTTLKLHVYNLSKYLSPRLSKSIIAGDHVHLDAMDKSLTVFFSDMQGYSQLSELLNPEELAWLVNSYLSEMSEIVFKFGGTLDKVIGDSIMVFFGDPNSRGKKNDAIACVFMAIAMREAMERLKTKWKNTGIENPPSIRMGINTGDCRVGNFGNESKLDYTAVGNSVNLASHLESIAQPDEILISETTYNLVKSQVKCIERRSTKFQWLSKDLRLFSAHKIPN